MSDKETERGIYCYHRKMRSSAHGQLFLNLCFGLIGLYLSFIIAVHSRNSTILCAFSGTFLQYFFLVSLFIMTAETISIYFVQVLKYEIQSFPLKATLISWSKSILTKSTLGVKTINLYEKYNFFNLVAPVFVVLFCFTPNYKNYISNPPKL